MAPMIRKAANAALVATALILAWMAIQQAESRSESPSRGLPAGTRFPHMALIGLSGDTAAVDFTGGTGDRLVVFYSIDCDYCRRSLPVYRAVSEMCDPSLTLAFMDVSDTTLTAWWEANGDGFSEGCGSVSLGRLVAPLSRYEVRATPTHYLVGGDGLVKHHGEGMLLEVPYWLDR